METWKIILMIVFGIPAAISFTISYRQAKRRGYIFHNTWVWATKEQRARMDEETKYKAYRLSKNVFFLLGVLFVLFGIHFATMIALFRYFAWGMIVVVIVYAIVQSVKDGDFK